MKRKKTGGQRGVELGGQFRWDSPIEWPEASNRSRKLIDYLTVSFLTATFALTCFITLAVLTRDEILKSLI